MHNPDSKGIGNLQDLMNSVMKPSFQLKGKSTFCMHTLCSQMDTDKYLGSSL